MRWRRGNTGQRIGPLEVGAAVTQTAATGGQMMTVSGEQAV